MLRIFACFIVLVWPLVSLASSKPIVLFDRAHDGSRLPPKFIQLCDNLNLTLSENFSALTTESLKGVSLLYLLGPKIAFAESEKEAVIQFLKQGGSLLLVIDQERRQSLLKNQINDLIAPFTMMLTVDTPYIHNIGAVALAGEINTEKREIPFSGGRAVVGGTPFVYQLDKRGHPGFPSAAYKILDGGGRIIVMGEGMPANFLGEKGAIRMKGDSGNPRNTKYWGSDSDIFMEEVISWLVYE